MKPAKKEIVVLEFGENVVQKALKQNTDRRIAYYTLGDHAHREDKRNLLATKIVIAKSTSILICGVNDVVSVHNYLFAEKRVQNAIRNQGKRVCIVAESNSHSADPIGIAWNLSYALGCAEFCEPGVYVVKDSGCYSRGSYDSKSF
jgi:hypothetical protein